MNPPSPSSECGWPQTLWTIGHSTRSSEQLLSLLQANGIQTLADVRRFPGSRRHPHFNVEPMRAALHEAGIGYAPFTELGGRRKVQPDSPNTAWRHPAFRGYADYMQSEAFTHAVERLKGLASDQRTAILCAEAVWWRCHRGLIADVFKLGGTRVLHILGPGPAREHPYTSAARIVDGHLDYSVSQRELSMTGSATRDIS